MGDAGDAKSGLGEDFLDIAGDEGFVLDDQDRDRLVSIRRRNHLKLVTCQWHAPLPITKAYWRMRTRGRKRWFQVLDLPGRRLSLNSYQSVNRPSINRH